MTLHPINRARRVLRGGPWLELAVVVMAAAIVMLVVQGGERERQGNVRTQQIKDLTTSLGDVNREVTGLRLQVAALSTQNAIKDRTIAELTAALIAKGGDPTAILQRQRTDLNRAIAAPTPPASAEAPRTGPAASPRPSAAPSPTRQPTPRPAPTPRPSPTPTGGAIRGLVCGLLPPTCTVLPSAKDQP